MGTWRTYWKHHEKSLGTWWELDENIMLTWWELNENSLRTHWEQEENENPSFTFTPCKTKKYIGAMLSLLIWLRHTAERRATFAKAHWIKVRCYWEHIGNKRENETRNFFNYLPSRVLRKSVTRQDWFFRRSQCEGEFPLARSFLTFIIWKTL
jgi:hypothetical protein